MRNYFEKIASVFGLQEAMKKREKKKVKELMNNLDLTDPRKRPANKWDKQFKKLTAVLYKYDEFLSFMNRYGFVRETFFINLTREGSDNVDFQRKLCSVEKGVVVGYYIKYLNLLNDFLYRYDFDESVKKELLEDQTKAKVICIYNYIAREKRRKPL